MTYIAKTIKGLEEISAKEINGKVILPRTIEVENIPEDPKTVTKIYTKELQCEFSSFEEVVEKIADHPWKIKEAFCIKCKREGTHKFKSVDLAKSLGEELRKKGHTIDYKDPKSTLYIDIQNNNCIAGILLKEDLHKRRYRIKHNNRSLNACIAAALIKIVNPKKTDTILDPFCKDSIIPIEAWMQNIKNVYSQDSLKNNIRNAIINCKFAKTDIVPEVQACTDLNKRFKKGEINHLITNIHISNKTKNIQNILEILFQQIEIVKDSVTIISINPQEIRNTIPKDFTIQKEIPVAVGEMQYTILHYKKSA